MTTVAPGANAAALTVRPARGAAAPVAGEIGHPHDGPGGRVAARVVGDDDSGGVRLHRGECGLLFGGDDKHGERETEDRLFHADAPGGQPMVADDSVSEGGFLEK